MLNPFFNWKRLVEKAGCLGDTFGRGGSELNEVRLFYETDAHITQYQTITYNSRQ